MLYLIGLGLSDPKDITVKGLECVRSCSRVLIDSYTSILTVGPQELESFLEKKVELADREIVEQGEDIIRSAGETDVAFLVVGDPLGATTHTDLIQRAVEAGVPYKVVHNASIMNAIGCCGLQLYSYGETISIPFWDACSRPESFLDKLGANFCRGLHTLCLLDIKVKEQSIENLARGRKIYEPPRFMTCGQACDQLMKIIERRTSSVPASGDDDQSEFTMSKFCPISGECLVVGVSRVGSDSQSLLVCRLDRMTELCDATLGGPLHSLVVPGVLHHVEWDMLRLWMPGVGKEEAEKMLEDHRHVVEKAMTAHKHSL